MKHEIDIIRNKILESKRIVILTHVNPDGDAIGGSLGLLLLLRKMGKEVSFITPNEIPSFLQWMKGYEDIKVWNNNIEDIQLINDADIIFNIDFNALNRLAKIEKTLIKSKAYKVMIDHHPNPESFNDITISDTSVSSASELVYLLCKEMGYEEYFDVDVAECFFAGIISDTGSFSHNSSEPQTYNAVADLLKLGVNKDKIGANIYANFSLKRMQLLGFALNEKLKLVDGVNAAYISLTQEELKRFEFKIGDTEGFVNYPLSIKGIHFSVLLIEKSDHIKLSFRSRGDFPVNELAKKYFNGGGHKNASAGRVNLTMDDCINKLEELIIKYKDGINSTWKF